MLLVMDLFQYIEEHLQEVFNQPKPEPFEEGFYKREDENRSMTNPDYFATDVELLWIIDNNEFKIFIHNSSNPAYPRRLEIGFHDGDIVVFALNRGWAKAGEKFDHESKKFTLGQLGQLMEYIKDFIRWDESFMEKEDVCPSGEQETGG